MNTLFSLKPLRTLAAVVGLLTITAGVSFAADDQMPSCPLPVKEHAWLQQLVGEWEADTEAFMSPDPTQPPAKMKGTESVKPLGGFWTVSEIKSTMMDQPFTGIMTLGYNPETKKYVGTWVDSMTGKLWEYEGTTDAAGKVLTLESEGACPLQPGKVIKFRDIIEVKDKDHKLFTSTMQGEDGKWITIMTSTSQRKH